MIKLILARILEEIMMKWLYNTGRFFRYLYRAFAEEGISFRAAALAYTTLLSLVPLTILGFTILSFFPIFHGTGEEIQKLILQNFTTTSSPIIIKYLDEFVAHVSYLSITNIVFLIIVALLMIYNINRAFNTIWHAERHFHFSLSFLVYFLFLVLSPILLGGVIVLGSFFMKLPAVEHLIRIPYVQQPLFFLLPYFLIFCLFVLFNWVLPSCRVKFFAALVGGLVTTVLFEVAKYLFTLYLRHFPAYQLLYGALATIPIFLVWLYFSWTIILVGALISYVTANGIPDKIIKTE